MMVAVVQYTVGLGSLLAIALTMRRYEVTGRFSTPMASIAAVGAIGFLALLPHG